MLTKGNFTRDEWNNLLHLFNISHFSSTCCTWAAPHWRRGFKIRKKKKELCPSRDQQLWICLLLMRQVPPPHRVRLHLKVAGCRQLRGNPVARWVLNQAHSTQRRRLQCDSRMHTLAGWWKSSGETRRIKKIPTILRLEPGTTKRNLLPKIIKLGRTSLHTEPVLQMTRKVRRIRKPRGTTISTHRRTHRTFWKPCFWWSGRSMENHLAILRKIWTWVWLFGECSWIPLFDSSSSRNRLWHAFEICKELSQEKNGTAFQGNRKATAISLKVGIDKHICTVELFNIPLPKSMCSPTLCSAWGKWETVMLDPERSKFNGIRTTIFLRIESNWWTTWKIFPGFTTVGIVIEIQQKMGKLQSEPENFTSRIIFMSMFNNIVWDARGNDELCVKNSKTSMPKDSLAVIGLSWGQNLKRGGTELTIANQMDLATWQEPVIEYSVVPVPWREENKEV